MPFRMCTYPYLAENVEFKLLFCKGDPKSDYQASVPKTFGFQHIN